MKEDNLRTVLELYKKGELNTDQAISLISDIVKASSITVDLTNTPPTTFTVPGTWSGPYYESTTT